MKRGDIQEQTTSFVYFLLGLYQGNNYGHFLDFLSFLFDPVMNHDSFLTMTPGTITVLCFPYRKLILQLLH